MNTDFLLIGQGISGTWLSYYLQKAGYSCILIDQVKENSASRVAAGMINPVTGRRIVKTWMIDELLSFAFQAYKELEKELEIRAIEEKKVVDFFPTVQMKMAFEKAFVESDQYLSLPDTENDYQHSFQYDFGYGMINPCYLVFLQNILPAWRKKLENDNAIRDEYFDISRLELKDDSVNYGDIQAKHIIFCDGFEGATNPWFKLLPYAPNKGEILWIEAPDLPANAIFKKGITVSPWEKNIFWAGPSYEWDFTDANTSQQFYDKTVATLQHWLKVPFKVVDHRASLRPANLERRPFVGFHPLHPKIGIFNGMGTKGCSLAPYFAKQFVDSIHNGASLLPEADVKRFTKVLSRNSG
jgi:glycine/D-amino acid oxidase-like deaminating enzyme